MCDSSLFRFQTIKIGQSKQVTNQANSTTSMARIKIWEEYKYKRIFLISNIVLVILIVYLKS